jgi:hypothetical protein
MFPVINGLYLAQRNLSKPLGASLDSRPFRPIPKYIQGLANMPELVLPAINPLDPYIQIPTGAKNDKFIPGVPP